MFNPSRQDARQFFFSTWRKYRSHKPLEGLETTVLDALLAHPEYHALLDHPDRYLERDYPPEFGETNPFLHLSMHLTIAEQLGIDQPPGIRAHYQALLEKTGDAMEAQHEMMDCLAEMIWQAQRNGTAFDALIYFACLNKKQGK